MDGACTRQYWQRDRQLCWHGVHTWESGAVGSDIGKVLLVGRGAYYVAEALRVHILHLIVPSRPELANAIGYAAQASELSQREVEKPTSYSALLAGNESDVPVSSPT